jgi:hypothetical protein|tara:strand:- start:2671 stop:3831 length:1161 start_codon:yes stop_codon:yes gene_type:complete
MNDKIKPKRKLGTGHYDRKLMERMVELSVADNYEEASEEWLATGNVYWGDMEIPDWWETPRKCLCGHRIEYHFEVQNEKNGNLILVGSDHINTYHILRHIVAERRQRGEIIHADDITDEMIDEWLSERVASMKQTAWWHAYGQMFEMMFEAVKEYDVRINVRVRKWEYNKKYGQSIPITQIRKVGKGVQGEDDYQMASIVWRWNHPDNPRRQIDSRGYPNDKLWGDLMLFYSRVEEHKAQCEKEDSDLQKLEDIEEKRTRLRESQWSLLKEDKERLENSIIRDRCDYFGIPDITGVEISELNTFEKNFMQSIRDLLKGNSYYPPSSKQMAILKRIVSGERVEEPSTYKQQRYLYRLGYQGEADSLTKSEASEMITHLLESGSQPEY